MVCSAKKSFESIREQLINNPNLERINEEKIHDGIQLRPKGTANKNIFTRHYSDVRIKRSTLIFKNDDPSSASLEYFNRKTNTKNVIEINKLAKTFRTGAGIDNLDATRLYDYIFREKCNVDKTAHLIIPNKFRLNTQETYLTAFYFDEPICPYNTLTMYFCSKEDAKILSLFFNSIFYLIQFLMIGKQSTRGFLDFRQVDFQQIFAPKIETINNNKRAELLNLFENERFRRFDSILKQLSDKPEYRYKIDEIIADSLGIKISKQELTNLYDLIYEQITTNLA